MTIVPGVWIAGVLVVLHAVGWFVGEAFTELEVPVPAWLGPTVAWAPALLAVVPAILLATLSRLDFARLAGRVWIEATVIDARDNGANWPDLARETRVTRLGEGVDERGRLLPGARR